MIFFCFCIRLESRQSPRPTTQPQPSRSESIPRISQLRENTAFPSSRQVQQAGSSARSLQTGSPSYSREGQLAGASSDASQESGWGSPSSWLANLFQGWQDVKDQYLFHHVPGCRCFRCNPAYYNFNGEYVTRPVVDFLLGSCPIGCLCPYCLEKRSIWKAQNKCRNDGHKLDRSLRCKSLFCACKIGCQDYSCIRCEPRAPENPILRRKVVKESSLGSQGSGERSDSSPSGTPKSRSSKSPPPVDQGQAVFYRGGTLQSHMSTNKMRRRKK